MLDKEGKETDSNKKEGDELEDVKVPQPNLNQNKLKGFNLALTKGFLL